jgi:predicted translin family RNA/ssDNA-binding protein
MKARLQSSPIFREILKNSKKISSAAANTDIGKKAQEVTNKVQDKIEDIREIWETSQNPLVYTLSGVWDSMTAETEEALTLTAIQKLDPNFSKVSFRDVFIILNDLSRSVGLKKSKPSLSHLS